MGQETLVRSCCEELWPLETILSLLSLKDERSFRNSCKTIQTILTNFRQKSIFNYPVISRCVQYCHASLFRATLSGLVYYGVSAETRSLLQKQSDLVTARFKPHVAANRLYIKHCGNESGYGVYSDCTIPEGVLLFFYGGEVYDHSLKKSTKMTYINLTISYR